MIVKKHIIIHIFLVLFLFPTIVAGNVSNVWEEFVKKPNSLNYKMCEDQIQKAIGSYQDIDNIVKINLIKRYDLFGKFLALLEKGNIFAVRLGFQLLPFTDGASKEDLSIALGRTLKHDPELFLTLLIKYDVSIEDIEGILLNYGDEYVDDDAKRISETQMRIEKIEQVRDKDLAAIKEKCLRILAEYKKRLVNYQAR